MRKQTWQPTKIPNLFRLLESGNYYLRVKPKNKPQRRESLRTDNFNVARERMRQRMIELQAVKVNTAGTWGSLVEMYLQWLEGESVKGRITQSTILYKKETLRQIERTWTDFKQTPLSDVTEQRLNAWTVAHSSAYAASRCNGAITVLRELLDLAVRNKIIAREVVDEAKHGLEYVKVRYDYKRMTLELPSPGQVAALRLEVYRRSTHGGWLFDMLIFSGIRIDSASAILHEDVHVNNNVLFIRKAKRGSYSVPLFPELLALCDKIKLSKPFEPKDKLLPTHKIQTVLTSSCQALGLPHCSAHTLRHIFATRAIESNVPISTVAAWLGHRDGGRTAQLVYGHLRNEHSQALAAGMKFLPATTDKPVNSERKT